MFFFAAWEGFRSRQGSNYTATVPLPEMYRGDFSGYRNASNAVIPIYDPLTQCGTGNNNPCAPGQAIQRTQFPGNIIPASRINPVSAKLLGFPLMALPNQPGQAFTHNFNFSALAAQGGNNDQVNGRWDYNVNEKLRVFTRFSRWSSQSSAVRALRQRHLCQRSLLSGASSQPRKGSRERPTCSVLRRFSTSGRLIFDSRTVVLSHTTESA